MTPMRDDSELVYCTESPSITADLQADLSAYQSVHAVHHVQALLEQGEDG